MPGYEPRSKRKNHYTDYGLSREKRTQRATRKQVSYSKIMANRMGISNFLKRRHDIVFKKCFSL